MQCLSSAYTEWCGGGVRNSRHLPLILFGLVPAFVRCCSRLRAEEQCSARPGLSPQEVVTLLESKTRVLSFSLLSHSPAFGLFVPAFARYCFPTLVEQCSA